MRSSFLLVCVTLLALVAIASAGTCGVSSTVEWSGEERTIGLVDWSGWRWWNQLDGSITSIQITTKQRECHAKKAVCVLYLISSRALHDLISLTCKLIPLFHTFAHIRVTAQVMLANRAHAVLLVTLSTSMLGAQSSLVGIKPNVAASSPMSLAVTQMP